MPCNSDYMEPTHNEIQESHTDKRRVKDYLDHLTHQSDLMREDILGVIEKRKKTLSHDYSKMRLRTRTLDERLRTYHEGYAYRNSGVDRDPDFERLVEDVREQYYFVIRAGKALQKNGTLPKKTMTDIATQQVLHRFGDMIRVMGQYSAQSTFKPKEVAEVLKYAQVDYTKPLIPQIGFDPDDV